MGIETKFQKTMNQYKGLPREIYIIFISRMVNAMGAFVWPLMTLLLTKKIGLSEAETGFYIMLPGLFYGIASLIGGKLADAFGRKIVIVVLNLMAVLLYVICGFIEPSMTTYYLILGAGFCYGMADPAHGALIADLTTPENRDAAYALSYMGFNLGFAIGPAIGGWLFERYLNWFFWGDAATAFVAILLLMIFVKETIHLTKEDVSEGRELEKSEEGTILGVLKKRPILIYFALVLFGYNFVYSQWGFMVPLHTDQIFADGAKWYGALASFNGFVVIACTPLMTFALHQFKTINRIVIGGTLYFIGFGMLIFTTNLIGFFIAIGIFTLGEIAVTVNSMPFIANHTPASHRGRMNSILPIIMGTGYTISPYVMGNVLEKVSITTAWTYVCGVMLVYVVFMFILGKYDSRQKEKLKLETA